MLSSEPSLDGKLCVFGGILCSAQSLAWITSCVYLEVYYAQLSA